MDEARKHTIFGLRFLQCKVCQPLGKIERTGSLEYYFDKIMLHAEND